MTELADRNQNKNDQEKDHSKEFKSAKSRGKFEKKVLVFLIIFTVIAISFSVWLIKYQIDEPFAPPKIEKNDLASGGDSAKIESLRERDTDQDGLTDYEELYTHKTSPYLVDSDSDGISDQLEIDQDTDPNCPTGTNCGRTSANTNTASGEVSADDLANLSADQLRQILKDSGVPEDSLTQISDEELIATYRQIMAEESGDSLNLNSVFTTNENSQVNSGVLDYSTLDYDALFNLAPDKIRQLLIENGVPADSLDDYDDETIQAIYQEALYENLKELEAE